MTQLILYTSDNGALYHAATDKESLSVQTEGAFKPIAIKLLIIFVVSRK